MFSGTVTLQLLRIDSVQIRIQVLALVECFLKQLRVLPAVFVNDMAVYIRYHIGLGVSGVSLDGFDIAAVQLQLVCDAGVSEAVKYNRRKVVVTDQLLQSFQDLMQTAPQTGRFCEAKRTRSGASGHLNLMI